MYCKSFPLQAGDFCYTDWTKNVLARNHTFGGGMVKKFNEKWFEEVTNCTLEEENLLEAVSD